MRLTWVLFLAPSCMMPKVPQEWRLYTEPGVSPEYCQQWPKGPKKKKRKNGIFTCRRMKLECIPCIIFNSKCISDLSVGTKTITLSSKCQRKNLEHWQWLKIINNKRKWKSTSEFTADQKCNASKTDYRRGGLLVLFFYRKKRAIL